jgi:beta-aspartyl-peptidase (threonine type)
MTNKRWGRIGDTPIVGAGVYADDRSCAVSATGHGEYFIRACVAHDVAARMRYAGRSLAAAADEVVFQELAGMGGVGGLIAVDRQANIVLPFNSLGMYRAWQKQGEPPQVAIYQKQ